MMFLIYVLNTVMKPANSLDIVLDNIKNIIENSNVNDEKTIEVVAEKLYDVMKDWFFMYFKLTVPAFEVNYIPRNLVNDAQSLCIDVRKSLVLESYKKFVRSILEKWIIEPNEDGRSWINTSWNKMHTISSEDMYGSNSNDRKVSYKNQIVTFIEQTCKSFTVELHLPDYLVHEFRNNFLLKNTFYKRTSKLKMTPTNIKKYVPNFKKFHDESKESVSLYNFLRDYFFWNENFRSYYDNLLLIENTKAL